MDAIDRYLYNKYSGASLAHIYYALYQRLINLVEQSIEAIQKKDIEKRYKLNKQALDIIDYMAVHVPSEFDEELKNNLLALYKYILSLLMRLDAYNSVEEGKKVVQLLLPQLEAWQELANKAEKERQSRQGTDDISLTT